MRPVLALAALGVLVVGSLAACSDDDPVRLPDGNRASFSLRPQLNSFGASQMLPINLIRLTVVSLPDSVELMEPVEETVDPEDPSWSLHLDVPLEDGEPVQVIVLVELINETGGVRTVEWSGIAGPFDLEPGETTEPPVVDLFRGSLGNLTITAVFIEDDLDTSILEGETLLLEAFAEGATGVPQFFWSTLAPTVAEVDTAGGDSAVIRALLPGVARIVVEAGQHADTIEVNVRQSIASIVVNPANDTVDALDGQALFTAQALDARGDPVPDVLFNWASSDTLVARHTETGSFRAMGVGTASIIASTAAASGITGTASLTVRQVVTTVTIPQADTTLLPSQTLALSATAADANGFTVAGATFTWSSSDTLVATVNASGVVDPRANGSAYIRAASGTGIDSVHVLVTTGPPATMTIAAGNDQVGVVATSLGADLVVLVEDASGNPVQGVEVSWFGDGDFTPSSSATDANGHATSVWTLDTVAGPQFATAAAPGDLGVTFDATATPGAVDSVDVEPDSVSFSAFGQTLILTAASYDQYGNACGCTASWTSRSTSVALVNDDGVVTAQDDGSTWIVANVSGVLDSAFVQVSTGGRVVTWVGSAPGAEQDWHTAANWSTGTVPGAEDTVFIPSAVFDLPVLSADAEIASYDSEVDGLLILNGTVSLIVHGDALSSGGIVATGAGNVVFDVAGSQIEGGFPVLSIFADVSLSGAVSATSVYVNDGSLSPAGQGLVVSDRFEVVGGTLWMTGPDDVVHVNGPVFFVDGQPSGTLTAGTFFAMSDLTNVGACGQFVSTGTTFVLGGDTANVSLDCPSALFDGNRFDHLTTTGGIDQQIFFNTHIIADRFTALGGTASVTLHGIATPIVARAIEVNDVTLDRLQLKQQTTSSLDGLNLLGVTFTGFAGTSLTQLEVSRSGDAPIFVSAAFDASSDGLYIDATDSDGIAPFVEMHVESPNTDGPSRTNESGGAIVRWSGQPYEVTAIGGDGQSGLEGTALPDSLRVRVLDVFGGPASGTLGWEVTAGGGSLSTTAVLLDVNGEATTQWTLGPAFTPQAVRAAISGAINEATFSATSITSAPGATITWTGTVSSDWNDSGNWSRGSLPIAADTAFFPAAAPNMALLQSNGSLAGVIIEAGATLDVGANTLDITSYSENRGAIVGTGRVRWSGDVEVRGGDYPYLEVFGQVFIWERARATSDVFVGGNTYLEMTTAPFEVVGNLTLQGDDAQIGVFDSLLVGGSLTVGGNEAFSTARLVNREIVIVGDSLLVAGRGRFEFANASDLLRIGGNARWISTEPVEGFMPAGTLEIAGDWYQDGPSFHSPALQTFFNGTSTPQTITHLNAGHGPGQGHFGPVHVSNPNGLTFLTPSLIRGELTSDAGVPIVIDSLVIEGHVVASGDVTFTYLDTRSAGVSGALAGTTLRVAAIPNAGSFAVDTTIYRTPDIETATANVNASLPYTVLTLEADSALFDGPATISDQMHVHGVTTLGGRTTVGGQVFVAGLGELHFGGHTLDVTGGSLSTGELLELGVIVMDSPTDSLIAESVNFQGGSTDGLLTAGTIVATSFTANYLAFHADIGHTVVIDQRGGVVTNQITTIDPSIEDGAGSRFGTLVIGTTAPTGLEINEDVAALNFVTTPGALLVADPGLPQAIMSDETHVDGVTFRNVPLQVLGSAPNGLPLVIDNTTFDAFDAGTTQLEITHEAAVDTFVFSGMTFDPIPDGTSDGSMYVSATRIGSVDANLRIRIDAINVTNGETFTLDDDGTADVIWPNDIPTAPPPATIAWTGEVSSQWFDGANWSDGVGPTGADTVHVFAAAPFQPVLDAQDSIAGIILEPSASVTLNATLVVQNHVVAGNTIAGPGALRMRGGSVSGTVPTLELAGTVVVAAPTTIDGDLLYVEDNAALLALFPTTINGNAYLDRNGAHLLIGDVVNIAGSVEVGAAVAATIPEIDISAALTIGGSLTTVDNALIEMSAGAPTVDIAGNAIFAGTFQTAGFLTLGTITVGGDFFANGGAFHSSGTAVVLAGGFDQRLETLSPGPLFTNSRFHDLQLLKSGGTVYLESDLYVGATLSENFGFALLDTAQTHTLTAAGDVDIAGDLMVDSLIFSGSLLNVGTSLSAHTTEFAGSGQAIPTTYGFENLVVSGEGALWSGNGLILGDLTVTGDLALGGDLEVVGNSTVVGALRPAGFSFTTTDLTVAGGSGLVLTDGNDQVHVNGAASFIGGTSALSAGTLFIESGASLSTAGDAFASSGTAVHMRGALLDMSDAGPGAGQGRLGLLVLETPGVLIDSAFVGGSVIEAAPSLVGDAGNPGPWRGLLRVTGDIVTPNTGYGMQHIALGGDLQIDFNNMDVDTVEFTGDGQAVHVEDPVDFSSIPYSTIVVTGPNVSIGDGSEYVDLSADVIVRGSGVTANLISNDNGRIGSLRLEQGDATTSASFFGFGWAVDDSVVVESGFLNLQDQLVEVNTSAVAPVGFRTGGTGALQMMTPSAQLVVANGDARFEGASTDGLLTSGLIDVVQPNATFYSLNDAFRSTGTALIMRGDSIQMVNSGGDPGQGLLADFQYTGIEVNVVDSLYIAGTLTDGPSAMLHDGTDDALVVVGGDAIIDQSQMVIDHFAISGALTIATAANWVVDTTTFFGTGQVAPVVVSDGFASVSYNNVVFRGGGAIAFGSASDYLDQSGAALHVRDAGTVVTIHSNDNGFIGALLMQSGDATTRFMIDAGFPGPLAVYDSVRVDAGVLDLNGVALDVNVNGVVPNGLTIAGTGVLEMNEPTASLDVVHGPASFTGGSTSGLLTGGVILFRGDFYSENESFASTGTYVQFGDASRTAPRLTMLNGGPNPGQGRFHFLEFMRDPILAGDIYVATDVFDVLDGTLDITGDPGASLEVGGNVDLVSGTGMTLSRLIVHGALDGLAPYNVDVTEYAGVGQQIDRFMPFDTILVSGSATRTVQIGVTDTVARVVLVNGTLSMAGGTGTQMQITDSLVVDGPGAVFDLNGTNMIVGTFGADGALVTRNGGVIASQIFGYLSLNGNAEFNGGDTEGRLTDGLFYFNGDFYAENGAFQASDNHESYFAGGPGFSTIRFATPGATSGSDHFGHLTIATGSVVNIASDVYALGDFDDGSDPSSTIVGSGVETIYSDGWDFSGGLTVQDVTLELNEDLAPAAGTTTIFGLTFAGYPSGSGMTRMVVRHPGLLGSSTIQFDNVDFSATEGDPGLLVHAIDSDAAGANPDVLDLLYYFAFVPEPSAFLSRTLTEDGAQISSNTP